MCKVNFVSEFNMLMRYAKNKAMPARERLLWIALFTIANDRAIYNEQTEEYDWPDDFIPIPNGELTLHSTLDKRGIETVRNSLRQRGLIDFQPGERNKKVPLYKINYLSADIGYKKVPNDVPNCVPNLVPNIAPNDVPNCVPNLVPNIAPNDVPNCVPNLVPNMTPKQGDFGYKNAPIYINNNKYNINQLQGESKGSPEERSQGFVSITEEVDEEGGFVQMRYSEVVGV